MLNAGAGVYKNACPMGKWFLAPAHPEGSGCPDYMTPKDYADMEWYGRQVMRMLRHLYYERKYPDGATFDAEDLARVCTRQFRWPVSVRTVWQLVQEGQGDSKARAMVLIATRPDGSIIGWDPVLHGPEPEQDECAELSCRTFTHCQDVNQICASLGSNVFRG